MPAQKAGSLADTYLELLDDGGVRAIPVTPEFWPDLIAGRCRLDGRLVMAARMTEDMAHWERHPTGDEILLLLSGRAVVVLEGSPAGAEEEIEMAAGEACIVPRGRWHRVKIVEPVEMVFMTPGEGTAHKAV